MDEISKKSKNPWWWFAIIIFAIISFLVGIFILFCYHPKDSIFDSTLIGSFFSLSGVLLFAATLVYQIKEYKMQITELRNSVEAQTATSKSLEEQTKLMSDQKTIALEQARHDFIFKIFENFNQFKARNEIQGAISSYYQSLNSHVHSKWQEKYKILKKEFSSSSFNEDFLADISLSFKESEIYMPFVKNYIQYAFNMLDLIDEQKQFQSTYKWFKPFFFMQLTDEEKLILYLSNLCPYYLPNSKIIKWNFNAMNSLLNLLQINDYYKITTDDKDALLAFFNEIESITP
jgi:hypothetical protein